LREGRAEVLNNYRGNFGTAGYSMNYLGICIIVFKSGCLFICQSFDISPKYWGPLAHSKKAT